MSRLFGAVERFAVWLGQNNGDNAFHVALFVCGPMLFTIVIMGWFE